LKGKKEEKKMKIDVSVHITPPKYLKALEKKISPEVLKHMPNNFLPGLANLDVRFKIMDRYPEMFYADSALHGNTSALMCGYDYFGPDKIFFGTDMPFGSEEGLWPVRKTIDSINEMTIPEKEREKIYAGDAKKLLRLKI
jgi:hypothetical protein